MQRTASRASMNSRHRLRRNEVESPGGKKSRLLDEALDEQDSEELALYPSARRYVATFWKVSKLQQGFDAYLCRPFEIEQLIQVIDDMTSIVH